jgi:hypothetical protein
MKIMALEKTVQAPQGFEAQNAYHRVEGLQVKNKTTISYMVRSYKDHSGVPAFADCQYESSYSIDGKNPIAQAYEHLKTLPEFENAKDC